MFSHPDDHFPWSPLGQWWRGPGMWCWFPPVQLRCIQSLSHVRLFGTPRTAAGQASLSPGVHSNSCPSSWWCHPTISSSATPFSSCPQSFPTSGSFPMSQHFILGGQSYWSFSFSISPSKEYSGLISFRIDCFDLLAVQETLESLLQHHNSKSVNLWPSAFFMIQLSHLYMTIGKPTALSICTFVSKLMSLLFNMLLRFVIAFLPRNKCLLVTWLQSPSTVIFEPKKRNLSLFQVFPLLLPWSGGTRCHDLRFMNLNFKPAFSVFSLRGSLVPLCFLPLESYYLHIWGCWYFSRQSWFQVMIHPAQHFDDVLCTEVK